MLITERANIRRSGCLAADVNIINAYVVPGKASQDHVNYTRTDARGIVRGDLLLIMAEGLNHTTAELGSLGSTIPKGVRGQYATRGSRSVKIGDRNIKPTLADAVAE